MSKPKPRLEKSKNNSSLKTNPKWFYFVLVLFPLIFLLFVELVLRAFSYGNDYVEWVPISDKYEILNPEIAGKYFYGINNIPFSTESFLLKNKPGNSFRLITLGASSGAGYPYQNSGSFSKYIRDALRYALPDKKIEVANISMAAINTYTILDLLPEIIDKEPDGILIYLGHNEYYGALGVASKQSLVNSVWLTNMVLELKDFRVYQLVENLIVSFMNFTNSPNNSADETLMSRIAGEKSIELDSELYFEGVKQFEANLRRILEICESNKVPVFIGTLACNLKDQKPFISNESEDGNSADIFFMDAQTNLNKGNYLAADSLFRQAKDLDALRFRAPELFNKIIKELSNEFGTVLVDVDSTLNYYSPDGIIGSNLMVDHLHPNLEGYQKIGQIFTEKILTSKAFSFNPKNINEIEANVKKNFNFTKYDSTISDFRIKILKNDWPFVNSENKIDDDKLLPDNTIEDRIAAQVLRGNISRFDGLINLYKHYVKSNNYGEAVNTIISLLNEFPNEKDLTNKFIGELISLKKYEFLERPLKESYALEPDAFNTKWLGIMYISNNDTYSAKKYFMESLTFNSNDPQLMFNIAGVFMQENKHEKAYDYILKCIKLDPDYRNAEALKNQLEKLLKQ